jgi:flagellar hook-length control protein FliK
VAPDSATLQTLSAQTVKNVRYLIDGDGRTVSVRLVPESLGEMHIEVHSNGGEVTVRLISQNPVVRDTLQAQTSDLRAALSRDGVNVDKVEVSAAMSPQMGASSGQTGSDASEQAAFQRNFGTASRSYVEPRATQVPAVSRPQTHSGSLNVFI